MSDLTHPVDDIAAVMADIRREDKRIRRRVFLLGVKAGIGIGVAATLIVQAIAEVWT